MTRCDLRAALYGGGVVEPDLIGTFDWRAGLDSAQE